MRQTKLSGYLGEQFSVRVARNYLKRAIAKFTTMAFWCFIIGFNVDRTYALYKRTILCINVNTLFGSFFKLPFLGCDKRSLTPKAYRWMGTEKQALIAENHTPFA
jgi:hypothetical protein